MSKIVEFKGKQARLKQWLNEVIENFFEGKDIENVVIIWQSKDNEGKANVNCINFDSCLADMKAFYSCIGDYTKELEFDEYLKNHLHEYLMPIDE